MAWYKTGTVTATNGNSVITGVDTRFAANSKVGDGFKGPDGGWYEIVNIASETVLSIYPVYQGATVSGSSTWMIAPLQGYNKESADRLRAITDSIGGSFVKTVNTRTGDVVLTKTDVGLGNVDNTSDANKPVSTAQQTAINGRQASNANLTAFSGLTGAADRLPYFTGAGALSLATLTAKAREFTALTNEANMRTWLGLVPVTSNTDITAGRLLTPGSGGILGTPVPVPNANGITFLSGTHGTLAGTEEECVTANYPALGGASTAARRWYIYTDIVDGTSAFQSATETRGVGTTKGRTFTRVLDTSWQPWVENVKRGNFGLGGNLVPYPTANLNDFSAPTGSYFVTSAATNTPYAGTFWGVSIERFATDGSMRQTVWDLNSPSAMYIRNIDRGAATPWLPLYNGVNALLDPQTVGGLMSSTVVSGWTIEKFLNGTMLATVSLDNSAPIPVNTVSSLSTSIPSGFVGVIYPNVQVQPAGSVDIYGVVFTYFSSATTLVYGVRNGSTVSQQFLTKISLKGRWK